MNSTKSNNSGIMWGILLAAFAVKMPFLPAPLIGYFGSYQVVNAMMTDMMLQNPWSEFWIPRLTILINGEPGYHLLYFPFGSFVAAIFNVYTKVDIDLAGRFQAAFFMMMSGYFVYKIAMKHFSYTVALWAVFLFSFFPMNLLMGINFQNEAIAVFLLLSSFLLLHPQAKAPLICSGLIFSLSLVARIHFILVLPGFILFLLWQKRSLVEIAIFLLCAAILLIGWYGAMYYLYKHNSDAIMTSLFNQMNDGRVLAESMIRNPEFFKRIFDITVIESMTPLASPFVLLGLMKIRKEFAPFLIWLLGALSCIVLLPQKVFDHPFYLIAGLPVCALLAGIVLSSLLQKKWHIVLFSIIFIVFSFRYFLPPALSSWDAKALRLKALGKEVQQTVTENDFVIAQFETSPEFLYYTKHKGWSFDLSMDEYAKQNRVYSIFAQSKGYGDPIRWLEHLKSEGAKYLIIGEPELLKTKGKFYTYLQNNYVADNISSLNATIYDLGKKP